MFPILSCPPDLGNCAQNSAHTAFTEAVSI